MQNKVIQYEEFMQLTESSFCWYIKKKRLVLQLHKAETFQGFSLKAAACSPKLKYITKCDLDCALKKICKMGILKGYFTGPGYNKKLTDTENSGIMGNAL